MGALMIMMKMAMAVISIRLSKHVFLISFLT